MKSLKVLFVEDNLLDVELLLREIKKNDFDCEYVVLDSIEDVEEELSNNKFDILISDYSLPGFTGLDVILLVNEKNLDLPVILVSGTIPDEKAIDAVLLGAKDYVLKDNLGRLVPAIKREIESLAQREKRKLNELFVNSLFESFIGIRISDRNRKIVRVNDTYCEITGYTKEELEGASIDIVTPKEDIETNKVGYEKFFKIGEKSGSYSKEVRKDGTLVEVIVSSHVVDHKSGQFVLSTFQDVTEVVRDNALFEKVSQQAKIGGWEKNLKTGKKFWTDEIYRIYQVSKGEFQPFEESEKRFHTKNSWELFVKANREAAKGVPFDIELEIIDAKGTNKWCRATGNPVFENGKVVKINGSFQDITDQKEKEIILEESKEKYQYLFESNPNPLLLVQDDGSHKIVGANQAAIELYGYSEEELLTMTTLQIRPENEVEFYLDTIKDDKETGRWESTSTTRAKHQKKNGEIMEVDIHWKRIEFNGIISQLVLINDVTEKAIYERRLKETNTVLSSLIDAAQIGVITIDEHGIVDEVWNPRAENMFGWSREEALDNFLPYAIGKNKLEAEGLISEVLSTGETKLIDIERHTKDGRDISLREYLTPIKNKNGTVERILLLIEDVTETRKIETALIESEEKYRNLVEASHDLIWRIGPEGNYNFINSASKEILGYEPEELIGTSFVTHVFPEKLEETVQIHTAVIQGASFDNFDLVLIKKDRNLTYLSAKAYPMRNNEGEIIGCSGTATDITHILEYQHKLEISLKEKEVLIKEIHHRVKNNLAVISGLFALHALSVEDENVVQIFNESQSRIKSIATIHEKLYQNDLFTSIEMKSYLLDLLGDIQNTFEQTGKKVAIYLKGDEVTLNVNQAVPFGILANELITNSFKYAFPGELNGSITLDIRKEKDEILFTVKDSGIGLPENFEEMKKNSLGMTLVLSLAEQLNGRVNWSTNNGTTFELRFVPSEMQTWADKA